ncbi:MAG: hypothetical protein AAF645_12500 [Myxococcota bacterium]
MEVEGRKRWVVRFNDNDGVAILMDEAANARRHVTGEFEYEIDNLRQLNGFGELCAFGTHGGCFESIAVLAVDTDFFEDELEGNGIQDSIDGGVVDIASPLVVTDWAQYTFGNDTDESEAVQVTGERVEIPHGRYRVTIYRGYGATDEEPTDLYMIRFRSTSDAPAELAEMPGNDGWF